MNHQIFDKLFWFSWVVQPLKPWSALWSRETFDPFVPCIFLALVLKPLCGLGCHHSPDNMSFVGLIKVANEGKEKTESLSRSWSSVVITCECCSFLFFSPFLFLYNHKRRVKPNLNNNNPNPNATLKYENHSVSSVLTRQTREAWEQDLWWPMGEHPWPSS